MVREAGLRAHSTVEEGAEAVFHLATSSELNRRLGTFLDGRREAHARRRRTIRANGNAFEKWHSNSRAIGRHHRLKKGRPARPTSGYGNFEPDAFALSWRSRSRSARMSAISRSKPLVVSRSISIATSAFRRRCSVSESSSSVSTGATLVSHSPTSDGWVIRPSCLPERK